jgi:FG-GAP-like repeat
VSFNVSYAAPGTVSATQITTTVPGTGTSGRISVATPRGTAVSTQDFFVPPSPYVANDVLVADRLALGTPQVVTLAMASKIGLLLFDLVAGQRASLRITGGTTPSTTVSIRDPHRKTVGSTVVITSGFIDPVSANPPGTYTVMVDPLGTSTGNHTLTLIDMPPDVTGTMSVGGPSFPVVITTPGQKGLLTFSGTSGQRISLTVAGTPGGVVIVRRPDGTTLLSAASGTTSVMGPTVLPATGTYSIVVDPVTDSTGTITLTLYAVDPDITGTITPGGPPVNVTIPGPGQNAYYTFAGTAGQRVSMTATSSVAASVQLLKPDQSILGSTGTPGTGFMDTKTLPSTGTYTVVVDPFAADTGTFTVTLYDVPADVSGSVTIGGNPLEVTIGVPGQNGTLTFSGTASQQVTVRITGNTMNTPGVTIKLLKPDGTMLTEMLNVTASFNLTTQTLPTTGTYSIVIDPRLEKTGSLNVQVTLRAPFDFDGDGKTDVSVFRPSTSPTATWFIWQSATASAVSPGWGASGDVPVAADYDGDKKADLAVFRPSTGYWYVSRSSNGTQLSMQWGTVAGDVPVPADYDGDGLADIAVYRPDASGSVWWIWQSTTNSAVSQTWGVSGDVPVPADYDGDGEADVAVFRPSTGTWWVWQSATSTTLSKTWGISSDIPMPGDYDGDSKADITVFRYPSSPGDSTWLIWQSSSQTSAGQQWGVAGDVPVSGDFDGDGKMDAAIYRPSTETWWILKSSTSTSTSKTWGTTGDILVPRRPQLP